MFKPKIHYSKASQQRKHIQMVVIALVVAGVLLAGLHEAYQQTKLEGAAEYKATCITNFQNGYLTVRTQCQPGYRSK